MRMLVLTVVAAVMLVMSGCSSMGQQTCAPPPCCFHDTDSVMTVDSVALGASADLK